MKIYHRASQLSELFAYIGARLAFVVAIIRYSFNAVRLAISSAVVSNLRNNAREPERISNYQSRLLRYVLEDAQLAYFVPPSPVKNEDKNSTQVKKVVL